MCAWLTGLGVLLGVPMWWLQYRAATRAAEAAEAAGAPRMAEPPTPAMD
jgi:hypothetical protein